MACTIVVTKDKPRLVYMQHVRLLWHTVVVVVESNITQYTNLYSTCKHTRQSQVGCATTVWRFLRTVVSSNLENKKQKYTITQQSKPINKRRKHKTMKCNVHEQQHTKTNTHARAHTPLYLTAMRVNNVLSADSCGVWVLVLLLSTPKAYTRARAEKKMPPVISLSIPFDEDDGVANANSAKPNSDWWLPVLRVNAAAPTIFVRRHKKTHAKLRGWLSTINSMFHIRASTAEWRYSSSTTTVVSRR